MVTHTTKQNLTNNILNNTTMHVKITREVDLLTNSGSFNVFADNSLFRCITFRLDVPEESAYEEEKNKKEALELAAKLEAVNSVGELSTKEIVYETGKSDPYIK